MINKKINITALIRYKAIDDCLSDKTKLYNKEGIKEVCLIELKKYDNINAKVSLRIIEHDIQNLKSKKLGYKAPIIIINNKYYSYKNKNFTIKILPVPLNDNHKKKIREAIVFTNIYKDFINFNKKHTLINTNTKCLNITALIRLKAIDDCLNNTNKTYSLKDLGKACLIELKKYDKTLKFPAPNTLKRDIKILKSEKFGYNAPILKERDYYYYDSIDYTIKTLPVPISNIHIINIRKNLIFADIYKDFLLFKHD